MSDKSAATPAVAARTAIAFRGGGFVPGRSAWAAAAAFAALLAAWHLASATGVLPALFMPSPGAVGIALWRLAESGALAQHVAVSLQRIALGWSLGVGAGLACGIAMGLFTLARAAGLPVAMALFPIPKIALLPLFILWLGIGEASKLATIGLGVFFPTVVGAMAAVDNVPRSLVRMGQSFGLPPWRIVFSIVLPGALPGILAGFRISAAIALILLVSAEMIGAQFGIGAFILAAGNLMQTDQLLAGVALLSVLGLAIGALLTALERTLLRWR
ncbi:MAG: ABC transporter permease [Alphaproteobacteria bacterium]|nr:ABC transporter permease [Alphaproteobacteria bacterium]